MYPRSERIWKQYTQNISAISHQEALYLLHYLTFVHITRNYLHLTEIIDLQRYRIIKDKKKVYKLLSRPLQDSESFLFPVNKN